MSRSYKKAVYKDNYGSTYKPWAKRAAAKAVRRFSGYIPDGGAYKRLFSSYDICDYISDFRFSLYPWYEWDHKTFLGENGEYHVYK